MVSTRSQINKSTQMVRGTKPVLVKELLPVVDDNTKLRATIWKVEPEQLKEQEQVTPTEEQVTPVTEESKPVDSPKKAKRVRKMPDYKSIVRTRSQKLKEAELYHEKMLSDISSHWDAFRREPKIDSIYGNEAELAEYLYHLRGIHPTTLKPEFVARVTEALPWFKWQNLPAKTNWCGILSVLAATVMAAAGAVYMQMKLHDHENMKKIVMMLIEVRDRIRA
jgi:hypothetical protein